MQRGLNIEIENVFKKFQKMRCLFFCKKQLFTENAIKKELA
jgi:hypothetical protein